MYHPELSEISLQVDLIPDENLREFSIIMLNVRLTAESRIAIELVVCCHPLNLSCLSGASLSSLVPFLTNPRPFVAMTYVRGEATSQLTFLRFHFLSLVGLSLSAASPEARRE